MHSYQRSQLYTNVRVHRSFQPQICYQRPDTWI